MVRGVPSATIVACILALPPCASGQATFELIHRFERTATNPIGRLVEAPEGALYGMTTLGGRYGGGTIFALRPSENGSFSTEIVHEFRAAVEGGYPWGSLILGRDGSFYGLASRNTDLGSTPQGGSVFRLTLSGDLSVLHAFSGTEGHMPVWRLLEASDGNFYGCTCGATDSTIFRLSPSGSFTALYRFSGRDVWDPPYQNGVCPVTELKEGADGFLYGEATYGGLAYYTFPAVPYGPGTLFRIDPRDGVLERFQVIRYLTDVEAAQPVGGLVARPGGAFIGTANDDLYFRRGSIFRYEPTGQVTIVHAFTGEDGARPYGGLFEAADGALYGTATQGGLGFGTVFKIEGNGQFAMLHAFTAAEGRAPVELMQARDSRFYGVTFLGGPNGGGTVYRLVPGGGVETLHAFTAGPWPDLPTSGVIEGTEGSLYGTTSVSRLGGGTVYRLSAGRLLTILHDFEWPEAHPSGLSQAADGFLYGTTERGGAHDSGTVFRIGTTGGLTVLHSFAPSSPRAPQHGVIQASDGYFYGTTSVGSSVFRMNASGNLTTLYSFSSTDGASFAGPLVEGADGALYGMMARGSSPGTIFKLTKSGGFTLLHTFSVADGAWPRGDLARAADGRLYGVTTLGGAAGQGTLFRLEPEGGVTTLSSFSQGFPSAVSAGRDGALYVVAPSNFLVVGGPHYFFRFTTAGLALIHTSSRADGSGASRLMQGSDGALYGTMQATEDRPFAPGGIFRLTLHTP
jgi:uncharacterized repeat protein (TIGR03803 family)